MARIKGGRRTFKILKGTPTGKKLLRSPRNGREDNIRMELNYIGIITMNWVDSAQDREN